MKFLIEITKMILFLSKLNLYIFIMIYTNLDLYFTPIQFFIIHNDLFKFASFSDLQFLQYNFILFSLFP